MSTKCERCKEKFKENLRETWEYLRESAKAAVKMPQFWTKVTALVLNTVVIMVWRIPELGESGLGKNESQICLFAHTVPAYEIVLAGLVLIYLLGEEPGQIFLRLLLVAGTILFGATGAVAIYNTARARPLRPFPLTIGVFCLLIAIVLFIDELFNEEWVRLGGGGGDSAEEELEDENNELHEN